jgi:hypothetical protein
LKISTGILAVAAVLGAIYAVNLGVRGYLVSATSDKALSCLEMLGNTTTEEEGVTRIVGSVRNNCDRRFSNVTVVFDLDRSTSENAAIRDMPDTKVAAYGRDLEPGATIQIKSVIPLGKDPIYRFDKIIAY